VGILFIYLSSKCGQVNVNIVQYNCKEVIKNEEFKESKNKQRFVEKRFG